jgi:hypothetical protein
MTYFGTLKRVISTLQIKIFLLFYLYIILQYPYLSETFRGFPKAVPNYIVHQTKRNMNITFEELRRIKHALPHGSVARIAQDLNIEEQTVRNYFGAHQYKDGQIVEWHLEPGPNGGIVHLEDTSILERAQQILGESNRDH